MDSTRTVVPDTHSTKVQESCLSFTQNCKQIPHSGTLINNRSSLPIVPEDGRANLKVLAIWYFLIIDSHVTVRPLVTGSARGGNSLEPFCKVGANLLA